MSEMGHRGTEEPSLELLLVGAFSPAEEDASSAC